MTSATAPEVIIDAELVEPTVDPHARAPIGVPCEACGAPVEPSDRFCPACGCPHQTGDGRDAAEDAAAETVPAPTFLRCENCGSEVSTDPDQRSYVCAFCDSTYVVEYSPAQTGRRRPEFIIGFAVTLDEAHQKYSRWIRDNSWFRPGDLKQAKVAEKLKGVYLPFWRFSMLARSRWTAKIGEYWYRTETYWTQDSKGRRVRRTRQVRETEWWPLQGNHHQYYNGFLVSGSRGLPQSDAERIKPFQLPALKRYEPYFLAGWLCEEFSVECDQALEVCQAAFYRREQENVANFMPGDAHRELHVSTNFSDIQSDLCLLPTYILSYRYGDKLFRFMVNGQTGKEAGDKPLSYRRIGLLVACGLLLIFVLVLLGLWLGS